MTMPHILVADDDPALRVFLTTSLETAGFRVTPCHDGLDALTQLTADGAAFDLLLTDIVMPGMDGIELSNRAREIFPHIHIMFITGFGTVAQDRLSDGGEAPQILAKPLHLGQMVQEVKRMLGVTPETVTPNP
jgi:two-component system, cell cycle response regulator CpdR